MGILRTDKISGLETPTAVTGSVSFDGNDHLSIGNPGNFNFLHNALSDWTAEFWAKVPSNTRQLVFGTGASSAQHGFSLEIMSNNDGQSNDRGVFAMFGRGSAGNYRYWGADHVLTENTWHHIAAVFKTSDKTLTLYVDGIEVDSGTGTANGTFSTTDYSTSNSSYAFLVAKNEHADTFLTGEISNLRVVNGRRLYTANFTPPVHALETINGTRILCCNNSDSVTAVSNAGIGTAHIATASGDPTVATDNPSLTRDFTYGTEFRGVTTFDTQGYFVPPSGTTEQRGRGRALSGGGSQPGNTNAIEYFSITSQGSTFVFGDLTESRRGVGACASSTRGIFAGGGGSPNPSFTNTIEFVTISSEGNSISFGDLDDQRRNIEGLSSQTRGVFSGGSKPAIDNVIEFITIGSLGDATNFGDLQASEDRVFLAAAESTTRGLFAGGYGGPSPLNGMKTIGYITIASTGDAQNFGDLFTGAYSNAGTSSNTRAVFAGGADGPGSGDMHNVIEYVTIATLGNAQDFGDLTGANENIRGTSNKVRGVFAGGYQPSFTNTMQYITISTTGNAKDFGDLISAISQQGMCSDSHGGLS